MALRVALPLGISLYILQSLSYVIDVYRGQSTAIKSFIDFLCFETMYPQLVAGPIIRYSEIEDQLTTRVTTPERNSRGASRSSRWGWRRRCCIANPCGKIADLAFEAGSLGAGRGLVRRHRVRLSDLLRLQRLLRHGDRTRPDARVRLPQELRLAVQVAVHHRVLAPLAHLAVLVAARLPVRSARRQPERPGPHLRQPDARDADWRPLARRRLELRRLGRAARRFARQRAAAWKDGALRPSAGGRAGWR